MATAKVFMSGNSQAVRLPKEFRIAADEVEISRRGDEIVLSPKARGLSRAYDLICEFSAEMVEGIKDDRLPEEREGL